jgi:hypothetical protein
VRCIHAESGLRTRCIWPLVVSHGFAKVVTHIGVCRLPDFFALDTSNTISSLWTHIIHCE